MLSDSVHNSGDLIAVRPDKELAPRLAWSMPLLHSQMPTSWLDCDIGQPELSDPDNRRIRAQRTLSSSEYLDPRDVLLRRHNSYLSPCPSQWPSTQRCRQAAAFAYDLARSIVSATRRSLTGRGQQDTAWLRSPLR